MKKTSLLVAVMCIGLMVAGPVAAEELTIVGTGSGQSILAAIGNAFTETTPGAVVSVPKSIGSGGGIKAVGKDESVIGRIARPIKDKEKHFGLAYHPIAKMPIVFFTNKSVGVKSLTISQVLDIYSGKITNWKDVGGKDASIRVIRREDGDSSLSVLLKTFPGFSDITLTAKSKTTYSDPDTCQLTANKANTIAFGTYANAKNYDLDVLAIEGVQPTSPDYQYAGTLALIFKEKNKAGTIQNFLDFIVTASAKQVIEKTGGIPVL
ncbi:MAG: substrate-binding domain-containing protein [Desulfobacterales bacterium]|nr:substrate-binding domain-containing protein [Desulfobacterales bacterium]